MSLPSLSPPVALPAPGPINDSSAVVQAFRRINKSIHEFSKAVDREFGITGPQLWAMRIIDELESCSAGDLAERLFVHPSTITGVIQRLEDKALIDRRRRPDDRRAVVLRLTPAGKKLLHRGPIEDHGHIAKALQGMPTSDVSRLRHLLDSLVEQMDMGELESRMVLSDD